MTTHVILSEARTRSVRAKSKDLVKWVAQYGKDATLRLSQSCKFFHSNYTIIPSMRSFDSVFLRGLRKTSLRMTNGVNAPKSVSHAMTDGARASKSSFTHNFQDIKVEKTQARSKLSEQIRAKGNARWALARGVFLQREDAASGCFAAYTMPLFGRKAEERGEA